MKNRVPALAALLGITLLFSSCYVETRPMYGGYRGRGYYKQRHHHHHHHYGHGRGHGRGRGDNYGWRGR